MGEIADIVGGGTPSTAVLEYWDGDIDWYAPAEISDQIFINSSQRKITTEGLNNSSAKMLPVGTVLFTSRAGIGKTAILAKEGCTNQGFQSIIPHNNELDSYFIFSRTDELKRYGETVGAGSTFVEVSGKQMANMTIAIPQTMQEQQQIGSYFRNLDHLITLHQRECFSFDFSGESAKTAQKTISWEQRKLGDMCDEFQSGKSIKASDITDSGEYAVYGGNGFRGYTDTYNHDGDYALIGRQGALCGNMNFSSGKAYFTEHAVAVHGNADNDTLFLYYLLDLMNLGQYSGQSAQPGLAVNKIIQLKTKAPKLDEQRLISSFFKQLDSLITLHQHKPNKKGHCR